MNAKQRIRQLEKRKAGKTNSTFAASMLSRIVDYRKDINKDSQTTEQVIGVRHIAMTDKDGDE